MLVKYSISISHGRYNLTRWQHLVLGQWGTILSYCEFFCPVSAYDAPLYKLFKPPEGVSFMLSLSYQLWTGHVASSLIIPPSIPPILQNFSTFLSSAPKCDDNSHEQNTKTKKTAAACSKTRASPHLSIFLFCRILLQWFWQDCLAVWHRGTTQAVVGTAHSDPVIQLAPSFFWWLEQRWTWGAEVVLSQVGGVCVTLAWL